MIRACHDSGANNIMGMEMDCPKYLHTDIYHDMLDRLERVRPTANQPCLRSAIIEILGEIGNVWPAEIYAGESENAA